MNPVIDPITKEILYVTLVCLTKQTSRTKPQEQTTLYLRIHLIPVRQCEIGRLASHWNPRDPRLRDSKNHDDMQALFQSLMQYLLTISNYL